MIGYHYVIRRDGSIEKGRPDDMVGAHTSGQNANSLGICYEGGKAPLSPPKGGMTESMQTDGNYQVTTSWGDREGLSFEGGREGLLIPADTRTPEQKATLLALLKHLKTLYPNATIHGHNEFARKACPCFDAGAEYAGL